MEEGTIWKKTNDSWNNKLTISTLELPPYLLEENVVSKDASGNYNLEGDATFGGSIKVKHISSETGETKFPVTLDSRGITLSDGANIFKDGEVISLGGGVTRGGSSSQFKYDESKKAITNMEDPKLKPNAYGPGIHTEILNCVVIPHSYICQRNTHVYAKTIVPSDRSKAPIVQEIYSESGHNFRRYSQGEDNEWTKIKANISSLVFSNPKGIHFDQRYYKTYGSPGFAYYEFAHVDFNDTAVDGNFVNQHAMALFTVNIKGIINFTYNIAGERFDKKNPVNQSFSFWLGISNKTGNPKVHFNLLSNVVDCHNIQNIPNEEFNKKTNKSLISSILLYREKDSTLTKRVKLMFNGGLYTTINPGNLNIEISHNLSRNGFTVGKLDMSPWRPKDGYVNFKSYSISNNIININNDIKVNHENNTFIDKELTVKGPATFKGGNNIKGDGPNGSTHFPGRNGNNYIRGRTFIHGDVDHSGSFIMNNDLNVKGNTIMESDLNVKGNTMIEKDLNVKGNTTMENNLDVKGRLISSKQSVFESGVIKKNPDKQRYKTMFPWKDDSENYIRGDTMLDGDLITEYGNVHIKGGQIEGKDPYGSLIVDRDATINGNTTVEKKLTVKDDSTFEKKLTVKDDSTFEKKYVLEPLV